MPPLPFGRFLACRQSFERLMDTASKTQRKESDLYCMKHGCSVDGETAACRDPKQYCKYRTSCLVWFLEREKGEKDPC